VVSWTRGVHTDQTHRARRLFDLPRAQYEIETRIAGAAKRINETLHTELERAATTARARDRRQRSATTTRDDDGDDGDDGSRRDGAERARGGGGVF
jgi:hypothetical protein